MLKTLLESACRLCRAEGAVLFRPDGSGAYLPAAYQSWQLDADEQARYLAHLREHPIRPGRDSIVGRALLQRELVCVQDVQADAEYGRRDLVELGRFGNVMAVPLLREGRAWVKLSGPYRFSAEPLPPYGDTIALARALIEAAPDQVVWATDWPHPALSKPMPQDAALLDLLAEWTADAGLRRRILVDNPARLYGFPNQP